MMKGSQDMSSIFFSSEECKNEGKVVNKDCLPSLIKDGYLHGFFPEDGHRHHHHHATTGGAAQSTSSESHVSFLNQLMESTSFSNITDTSTAESIEGVANDSEARDEMNFQQGKCAYVESIMDMAVDTDEDQNDLVEKVEKEKKNEGCTSPSVWGAIGFPTPSIFSAGESSDHGADSKELEEGEKSSEGAVKNILSFLYRNSSSSTSSSPSRPPPYDALSVPPRTAGLRSGAGPPAPPPGVAASAGPGDTSLEPDVYEALQRDPINATRINFRSFHCSPGGTAGPRPSGVGGAAPSTSSLDQEPSVGLFIGQLPCSYSQEDIKAVLLALAKKAGQAVQVRSVKSHGAEHTCAFAMINSSGLAVFLRFHRRVICDLNSVWLIDECKIPYVPTFLDEISSHHFLRCGVPRAALVLEKLVPQRKQQHHHQHQQQHAKHVQQPCHYYSYAKETPPMGAPSSAFSTIPCTYFPHQPSSPAYATMPVTRRENTESGRGHPRGMPHAQSSLYAFPKNEDTHGSPMFSSSHALSGPPLPPPLRSSSFSSMASISSNGVRSWTVASQPFAPPEIMMTRRRNGEEDPSLPHHPPPPSPSRSGGGGLFFPSACAGGGPLMGGTPWSPLATTNFFFPTVAGGTPPSCSSLDESGNVFWVAMPPLQPPLSHPS